MRWLGLLALLFARFAARVSGHPQCFYDGRPPDPEQVLTFCPAATDGACCSDFEEEIVAARFGAVGDLPSSECADLYSQVVCGVCHSYSGHLYERLGGELGALDGLTMKKDFCQELVSTCEAYITFPTYDGEDYCTKHTGGGDDFFWSYPYEDVAIFNDGLTQVFDDQSDFPSQTISITQTPDGSAFWLMGQAGEVKTVDASDLTSMSTVVDISSLELYLAYEEGLVGMTFGPLFGVSGYPSNFYLSYTVQLDMAEMPRNRLAKFEYFAGDTAATLASAEILITSAPKFGTFHSAGWAGFKPSAYGSTASYHDLYWSMGDSGPHLDTSNSAQDTVSNLHGSIIRISVPSDGTGYEIPSGNLPSPAMPEICAHGFRNPWRCSFDRETDELYCGDVGHTLVEEIDLIECGKNYGWAQFEGSRCVEDNEERFGACVDADRSGFTFPMFEYCHPDYYDDTAEEAAFVAGADICGDRSITGSAIIGGFVYRGTYFDDLLSGAYIFGDNTLKNVYFIKEDGGEWTVGSIISDGSVEIIAFAETNEGELMMITKDYTIYHLPCGDLCASTCLDQAEDLPTYESKGCFADLHADRAMEIGLFNTNCPENQEAMSPAICASYCSTIGATYAGVEWGKECFCGNSEDYSRHGTSTGCTMICEANPDEICGGFLAIEVFELSDPVGTDSSNLVLAGGPTAANGDTAVSEDGMSASSKIFPNNSTVTIGSALVAVILVASFMAG